MPAGFVTVTGRVKDVILRGGVSIGPVEIDAVLLRHPRIADAAAVGVPHPKWDERPILVVVPHKGKKPPAAEIVERLAPHFAKWQLPDDVVYVEEIPHTATGKISKLKLRQLLESMRYKLPDQRGAG